MLTAVTAASVALHRRQPYLLVGWLWFLGTLVPVIGLVQIGGQAMADRYSYVPLVGVFIMAAWGIPDATASLARRRWLLGIAAGAALTACAVVASRQLAYWKNGVSLFHHALAVTTKNWVAHANLAATLSKTSTPEANAELQDTLRILAEFADTYNKKGIELERTPGRLPEAIQAIPDRRPDPSRVLASPHFNLGVALAKTPGRTAGGDQRAPDHHPAQAGVCRRPPQPRDRARQPARRRRRGGRRIRDRPQAGAQRPPGSLRPWPGARARSRPDRGRWPWRSSRRC